jgi:hypothetical protein
VTSLIDSSQLSQQQSTAERMMWILDLHIPKMSCTHRGESDRHMQTRSPLLFSSLPSSTLTSPPLLSSPLLYLSLLLLFSHIPLIPSHPLFLLISHLHYPSQYHPSTLGWSTLSQNPCTASQQTSGTVSARSHSSVSCTRARHTGGSEAEIRDLDRVSRIPF